MNDINQYRGNSHNKRQEPEPKTKPKVKRVISAPPKVRKKSVWGRMRVQFTGADASSVGDYLFADVIVPAIKDLLFNVVTEGARQSLYSGDRHSAPPVRGGRSMSRQTPYARPVDRRTREEERPRQLERRERATHDFSNLSFRNAGEAEVIADTLFDRIKDYGVATVADFYDAMGMTADFTDDAYGWTDLTGTRVRKIPNGYILDLPRTEQLDNNN